MAYVTSFTCTECRRGVHELVACGYVCARCRAAKAEAAENAHMGFLSTLPLEERVRRIELALYRQDLDGRLSALEVRHITY